MSARCGAAADVLILGGGPAAVAAALGLAHAGLSSCVVERSRYHEPRIGEHLSPDVQPLLERLSLWPAFLGSAPVPSTGVRVAWNRTTLDERDYIFSPYGSGWNVDRRRFDALLATGATEAGVEVLTATRLAALDGEPGHWRCRLRGEPGNEFEKTARIVVDATGRSASLARRLGGRRDTADRLIGLCAWYADGEPDEAMRGRLLLEAAECGWWYAVDLPARRMAAVLLSDRDLVPLDELQAEAFWHESIDAAPNIAAWVRRYGRREAFRVRAAHSFRMAPAAGPGWLAIGDAAMAVDPLSSMGIAAALHSGIAGAAAIAAYFAGDLGALTRYSDEIGRRFRAYLGQRQAIYAQEQRWPEHPFWRRRHSPSVSGPTHRARHDDTGFAGR